MLSRKVLLASSNKAISKYTVFAPHSLSLRHIQPDPRNSDQHMAICHVFFRSMTAPRVVLAPTQYAPVFAIHQSAELSCLLGPRCPPPPQDIKYILID